MKKLLRASMIVVALLVTAVLALAQVHGVPPSVTSISPFSGVGVAPPPSVTSMGPRGVRGPPFGFNQNFRFRGPFRIHPNRRLNGFGRGSAFFLPIYPYYIPYYGDYEYPYDPYAAYGMSEYEGEPPAPTMFERRAQPAPEARLGTSYMDTTAPAPTNVSSAAPAEKPQPPSPQPATMLVFRDGHTLQVTNYAIFGQTLFNLSGAPRKIPLADLDLQATEKTNDDRGVEFTLPAR